MTLINNIIVVKTSWSGLKYLLSYISKFNIITNGEFVFYFMLGGYIFENRNKIKFRANNNNNKNIVIIVLGLFS